MGLKNAFSKWERRFFMKEGRIHLNKEEWKEIIEHLERMLESVKFGSITLVVQDGKIIQIEKNEKVRLLANKSKER